MVTKGAHDGIDYTVRITSVITDNRVTGFWCFGSVGEVFSGNYVFTDLARESHTWFTA